MWSFFKQKQAKDNFAEWDIKERVARNVGRNRKGQFTSKGKANWMALLVELSKGTKLTSREMTCFGWQADRTLRWKGRAERFLSSHGIKMRWCDLPNNERQKWVDPLDLEKLRAALGKTVDLEV